MNPTVKAIVLADAIYTDTRTQKLAICGTVSEIVAREYPAVIDHLAIYVTVTGLREGAHSILVECVDLSREDEDDPVLSGEFGAPSKGPLDTVELVLSFLNVRFPVPGWYAVNVKHHSNLVGTIRVRAR